MKFKLNNFTSEISIIDKFESLNSTHKVIIIDEFIFKSFGNVLKVILKDAPIYIFSAIESNKTFEEVKKIFSFFIDNKVNRETVIFGIGGGITTDIAAFAASTFKRGCRLQLIPTTFLGMIDASIGGKTAINFKGLKNSIGSFYPAEKIFIYPDFLKTLSEKDLKNGWAECVKVALILDNGLYEILSDKKYEITLEIVQKAIDIKMELCQNDLKDSGERRKLNLGHTFAHIIETASNYKVNHGEAVAIGIRKAAEYSFLKNMIAMKELKEINSLVNIYDLSDSISDMIKSKIKANGEELIQQDKKAGKKVKLVLFKGIQDVVVKEIDDYKKIINLLIH